MSKPTLVFVHGAWHTPECWDSILGPLKSQGFKCIAAAMPSSNTEPPTTSLKPDIEQIQEILRSETGSGSDVVLVTHSIGGVSGSSSIKGFTAKDDSLVPANGKGRVIGLAMLTSWIVPTGTNNITHTIDNNIPRPDMSGPNIEEGLLVLKAEPSYLFYNDLPETEAELWTSRLRKHSLAAIRDKEDVYGGWLDVPCWYLKCTKDQAIVPEAQRMLIEIAREMGADVTVKEIEASHSPFLSRPRETVDFITNAAEAFRKTGEK